MTALVSLKDAKAKRETQRYVEQHPVAMRNHYLNLITDSYYPDESVIAWYMRRVLDFAFWGLIKEIQSENASPAMSYHLVTHTNRWSFSTRYHRTDKKGSVEVIKIQAQVVDRPKPKGRGFKPMSVEALADCIIEASKTEMLTMASSVFMSFYFVAPSGLLVQSINDIYLEEMVDSVPYPQPAPATADLLFNNAGCRVVADRYACWEAHRKLPDGKWLIFTAFYNPSAIEWMQSK